MTLFQKWANILVFVFLPLAMLSQQVDEAYEGQELKHGKSIDEMDWNKVMGEVDYSENLKKKKKKIEKEQEVDEEDSSFNWAWWDGLSNFVKIICIVILVGVVSFIIYRLTLLEPNRSFKSDRSLEDRLEDAEEELEESELERLLKEAIVHKEYKMAIRIYFLLMLQKLSDKNLISYKKEKTNFLYLLEMKSREEYSNFRKLTHVFEYSWYGEVELNESIFQNLQLNYRQFIDQLDK